MEYFLRRDRPSTSDFEESYWGTVVDPDGNVRDRHSERDQHVGDFDKEIGHLNSLPGGRLVDVGCGLGFLLSALEPMWERYGVELSAYAAEHASQWADVHVGDLESAAYETDFFDAVVMSHVIEHVPDPLSLIKEIWRIMKPGATLILCTPDFDSGAARHFGEQYRLLHDKSHTTLFSSDSMHRFLRDHGFIIDHVDYPYFETRYFTEENLMRLFDTSKVSPPFYGNFMSFYCRKPLHAEPFRELSGIAGFFTSNAEQLAEQLDHAGGVLRSAVREGGKVFVGGDAAGAGWLVERLRNRGAAAFLFGDLPQDPSETVSSVDLMILVSSTSTSTPSEFEQFTEAAIARGALCIGIGNGHGDQRTTIALPGQDSVVLSQEAMLVIVGLLAKQIDPAD